MIHEEPSELSAHQQGLMEHWVKYMGEHPEYVVDAIKRHFDACPWDKQFMAPLLRSAWRRNGAHTG